MDKTSCYRCGAPVSFTRAGGEYCIRTGEHDDDDILALCRPCEMELRAFMEPEVLKDSHGAAVGGILFPEWQEADYPGMGCG